MIKKVYLIAERFYPISNFKVNFKNLKILNGWK